MALMELGGMRCSQKRLLSPAETAHLWCEPSQQEVCDPLPLFYFRDALMHRRKRTHSVIMCLLW